MNGIFDSVEMNMLEELSKKGAVVGRKYSDKKKYLKELIRRLYLNLWFVRESPVGYTKIGFYRSPKVQSICGAFQASIIKTDFPITGLKKNPRRKTGSCGVEYIEGEGRTTDNPYFLRRWLTAGVAALLFFYGPFPGQVSLHQKEEDK